MSRRTRARGNSQNWAEEDEIMDEGEAENRAPGRGNPKLRKSAATRNSNARASQAPSSQVRLSQAPSTSGASRSATTSHDTDPYELTQGTQRTNANKLSEEEENNLIGGVIRYMLVADRPKTLLQRANIIKAALSNHTKHYKTIMGKVQSTLKEIFGYNLVELEGTKYILTNNLDNNGHINFPDSVRAEQVLLFIALAHIFMTEENACREDDLFDLFRALDIIEDNDFKNEYFGDVKYLLTDKFLKQGYLERVVIEKSDPPVQHYQWGVRAENEITPRHVLEFMSKIFGGRPLNTWPNQFKTMQTRENLNVSQ